MAHQFPFIDTDHSTSSTTIANLRADYTQFGVDSTLNLNVSGVSTFGNTVSIGATVYLTGSLTDGSTQVGAAGSILSSTGSGIRWIAANTTNVNSATNVGTNANATDADQFVAFMGATSGNNPVRVDAGLTYNPSSNYLTAGGIFVGDGSADNTNNRIRLGANQDLDIFHDAKSGINDGRIVANAGHLKLETSTNKDVFIRTGSTQKTNLKAVATQGVEMYFDGTERIRTADGGVVVSGVCTATSFDNGGTSSQFLKANGSVDSNTYVTSDTTYDLLVPASTTSIRLDPSSGSNDDIAITGGTNVTVTRTSATELTIAAASGSASIPSGSVMLFYQASAPTGWTKVSTIDNKALRVVSGTGGGSGGNNTFTTVFSNQSLSVSGSGTASGTTGNGGNGSTSSNNSGSVSISGNCGGTQSIYTNTTQNSLSIAQLAAHTHAYDVPRGTSGGQFGFVDSLNSGSSGTPNVASTGSGSAHGHGIIGYVINGSNFTFSGSGSPSNHSHTGPSHSHSFSDSVSVSSSGSLDMRVQYIDVIICTKD